jgi:hypothetical protein
VAQTFPPKQPNKPALGRGLEDLLGKPAAPESREDLFDPPAELPPSSPLSAGFSTLLRANQNTAKPAAPPDKKPADPLLSISLIAADLLLAAAACQQALTPNPTALNWWLCGLSLTLGAWLSILACWDRAK